MSITVTFTGDRHIMQMLNGGLLEGLPERLVTKTAIEGENQGKTYSPIDTGRLRASMTHQASGRTGWFGTNVRHGLYLDQPVTRRPHYRRGPYAGGSTAGWLSKKAREATAAKLPEIIEGEIRVIERRWGHG